MNDHDRLLKAAQDSGHLIITHITTTPKEHDMSSNRSPITLAPEVNVAIEAFRSHERKRFNADMAEADLSFAVIQMATQADEDQRAEYFRQTEEIRAEYERKREKAKIT